MSALICGSVAYDTVMVFPGRFRDHILPDRIHMLNVAFLVPSMKRNFGGCAGNIAYNLGLLGARGLPMATVGHDFGPYQRWAGIAGIPLEHVRVLEDEFTAQAFITTDLDDNQITAFHPGAMSRSQINRVPDDGSVTLGVVAPDGRDGMLEHAQQFAAAGIPWIFDPGQAMPMFSGDELRALLEGASALAVNDYECTLMCEKTGLSPAELAARVDAMIVTRGGEGSTLHHGGRVETIPPAPAAKALDPTGCGDAYRGGLLHGLSSGLGWPVAARLGSVLGAMKIEHLGPQNHRVDRDAVARRYREVYGASPW